MRIENETLILRDMIVSDIDDVIMWNTTGTEWMNWDAPWEHEKPVTTNWDAYRKEKSDDILNHKDDNILRTRFEICLNDEKQTHIGSISCYFINDAYKIVDSGTKIAIGMALYNPIYRGHGYGKQAYLLYMDYLATQGYTTIFTQTWSGNLPLIKMVEKLGFVECNRYKDLRFVKNKSYDGLTFIFTR